MSKIPRYFVIICLSVLACASFVEYRNWDFDDGLIVYRIVHNIINHGCWCYNLGEQHNSSTSALNTIILSAVASAFGDIQWSAHILESIWIFGAALLVVALTYTDLGFVLSALLSFASVELLAESRLWGLETHLFIFIFLAWLYAEKENSKWSWPLLGAAILTRPDAVLLLGFRGLKDIIQNRCINWRGLGITILILIPWMIFSWMNFGEIFPATLSNKVWQGKSGFWGSGYIYLSGLGDYWQSMPVNQWLLAILVIIGITNWIYQNSHFLYLLFFALIQQCTYIFLNVPPYHWYFATLDLLILISCGYGIGMFWSVIRNLFGTMRIKAGNSVHLSLTYSFLAFLGIYVVNQSINSIQKPRRDSRNESFLQLIKHMKSAKIPEGAVAAVEVGTLGYHLDRHITDILGLASQNPEYITSTNLDLFFRYAPAITVLHLPPWHFEKAIFEDIRFKYLYDKVAELPDLYIPFQYYSLARSPSTLDSATIYDFAARFPRFERNYSELQTRISNLPVGLCSLDRINNDQVHLLDRTRIKVAKPFLSLEGWLIPSADKPTSEMSVVLFENDGSAQLIQGKRTARPDVDQSLRRSGSGQAGFTVEADIRDLKQGLYAIRLLESRNGEWTSSCDPGVNVQITNSK